MSYKGRSYKDDKFGRRNYIQEQRDIAQAKIDVAEGGTAFHTPHGWPFLFRTECYTVKQRFPWSPLLSFFLIVPHFLPAAVAFASDFLLTFCKFFVFFLFFFFYHWYTGNAFEKTLKEQPPCTP